MVGIVILDYNNAIDTMNCIDSVVKYTPQKIYKIIVVENGSNKETIECMNTYISKTYDSFVILEEGENDVKFLPQIVLLISKENSGYAEGNNKALRLFEGDNSIDSILILNNDILFIEDVISPLYPYLTKIPKCGIISPLLLQRDGKSIDYNCARHDYKKMQFFWEYLFSFKNFFGIIGRYEYKKKYLLNNPDLLMRDYFEIELPSGSCMLIRKELFKDIDYFDKQTFLYFEENILYRKLREWGKTNYLIPRVKCIHLGASTSKRIPSMFTIRCQMKSTAYYLRRYRHAYILAAYVDIMSYLTIIKIWVQGKLK